MQQDPPAVLPAGQPAAPPPEGGQFVGPPASPPEPAGRPLRRPLRRAVLARRGPRSLTSKITLFVVSLVVVLVAVIGTATFLSLRSVLYDQLDNQLAIVANGNAGRIGQCFNTGQDNCAIGDGQRNFKAPEIEWVAVVAPGGQAAVKVNDSDSLRSLRVSNKTLGWLMSDARATRTITTSDGVELRITGRQVDTDFGDYTVFSGLSTTEPTKTLSSFVRRALLIGAGAVVVALFVTAAGVRFSLRRLRRVTATAEGVALELSPEGAGLDRRVPDDEPDTEVGQLATSFNTMLSAVETQFAARVESEQRMRQFLADASHELRTPLTSIRGYAELARMQRASGDAGEDNLDRIEFEGTRMSRLVEDLLLLARNEGSAQDDRPLERQLVSVSDLLADAVSGVRAAFPQREITDPDVAADAYVLGDPDQLLRVVRNLVTNAAVHTAPDRPIHVVATSDPDHHGVTIRVVDGGPGLPPDEAAHVFERFWRADKARTRARGGSGLGMSIVATIVRRHGGTVRFDSTVEGGSTVTVWLPAAQSM